METNKKIFVVDSQRLNSLQMCMRQYFYKFGNSFEPVDIPPQFEIGTLVHVGLEFYYKALKISDQWESNGLTRSDIIVQAIDHIRNAALSMKISMEDVETVVEVFLQYVNHYTSDGWDNILAVEESGTKILYEDEKHIFVYEFKIDLIIGLKNFPAIWVDHKSYSRKSYTSDMNNQFLGYSWALGINNGIVNKVGLQKTVKPPDKFIRETLSYTQDRIDEWVKNSVFWIRQGLAYMENNLFPMNFTSCDKWSGCSFRSVCMKSPEDRKEQLEKLYSIRESQWDVGKGLEGHKE